MKCQKIKEKIDSLKFSNYWFNQVGSSSYNIHQYYEFIFYSKKISFTYSDLKSKSKVGHAIIDAFPTPCYLTDKERDDIYNYIFEKVKNEVILNKEIIDKTILNFSKDFLKEEMRDFSQSLKRRLNLSTEEARILMERCIKEIVVEDLLK
jgi:hypothetical protein